MSDIHLAPSRADAARRILLRDRLAITGPLLG